MLLLLLAVWRNMAEDRIDQDNSNFHILIDENSVEYKTQSRI